MSGMELNRPSVERISNSPPLPITWKGSEEGFSPELEPRSSTEKMEVIDVSSDDEEMPTETHESRMEVDASDGASDETADDADLDDEETSDSFDDTAVEMDVDTFEDEYGDEDEEAESGDEEEDYGEPPVANFTGILESDIYDEEGNIDPAALAAAVRDYDDDTYTQEQQSGDFTGVTRSGYEDAYSVDPSEPVRSNSYGDVDDSEKVGHYSNKGVYSTGPSELVQFREQEGHVWDFNKISQHANEDTHSNDLTDTQQIKTKYADILSASHASVDTGKKKQMQSIDLTESDDEIDVQVQVKQQTDVAALMQVQNSPMYGIQPADFTRLPMDRAQVHFKPTVEYEPKSVQKIGSHSHSNLEAPSKTEPGIKPKVASFRRTEMLPPPKPKVQNLPKTIGVTQPKSGIVPSGLAQVENSARIPSGHEIFEILLVDLLDVQCLRNLINSHIRAIYTSLCPAQSTYDVVITRDLKSGDWVAHALVHIETKKQWMMLMESRDQKGYMEALQKLQAMAMEKMSKTVKALGRFGGRVQGFPF